jgi:hypothetical protein
MAFTPNSKVYLLDTPLNNKNTRQFKTLEEQQDYFFSRQKHTFVEVEYLGVSDSMCVNEHVDSLRDSNYVM